MKGTAEKDGSGYGGGDAGKLRQRHHICSREARIWGKKKRCGMMRGDGG